VLNALAEKVIDTASASADKTLLAIMMVILLLHVLARQTRMRFSLLLLLVVVVVFVVTMLQPKYLVCRIKVAKSNKGLDTIVVGTNTVNLPILFVGLSAPIFHACSKP
jgi:hypothetical protein